MHNLNPTATDLLAAFNVILLDLQEWQDEEEDEASTATDELEYAEHRARFHAYRSARYSIANVLGMVARDTMLYPDVPPTLLDLIEYADRSEFEEVIQSLRP